MSSSDQTPRVTFAAALRYWAVLGCVNFGGPAGQIAMLHRDLVVRRRWISEERFLHALNFCMLLPGPEATELAIYIGWLLHGAAGGVAAGVLFLLPSVLVLLGLSWAYAAHGNLPLVAGALAGLKPVVVAVVAAAVWKIGRRALKRPLDGAIAAGAFLALTFFHAPFPLVIAAAAAAGALQKSEAASPAAPSGESAPRDGTKLPARRRAIRLLLLFCALWASPLLIVSAALGWGGPHARAYRFFSQAAFVTFGGAYAVLPFVAQGAVAHYGWLSRPEMVHGLALAETTPGPLILVTQYVGFFAGWNAAAAGHAGGLSPLAAGALAAALTTWVTFLPCFYFVLVGAPVVDRLARDRRAHAALSGVTAAVVGVIATLGVTIAREAFFRSGRVDLIAVAVALVAFIAAWRFKVGPLWLVGAGAAYGIARSLLLA